MVLTLVLCACPSSGRDRTRGTSARPAPDPTSREEAARQEQQGLGSNEVLDPPAWVNDPNSPSPPPASRSPWVRVGRTRYLLGQPLQLKKQTELGALLAKPGPLSGQLVRVGGQLEHCGEIQLLRLPGKESPRPAVLMVRLPVKAPDRIPAAAVLEGTLTVEPKLLTKARLTCKAALHSPALLVANSVLINNRRRGKRE